ncbi:hypothetical protein ONS96_001512 [Cadophora gregata f. sp. sojae]|nr:hypothetical protein ONS96_001512 [Cadophora gregata f. sp. sojae]
MFPERSITDAIAHIFRRKGISSFYHSGRSKPNKRKDGQASASLERITNAREQRHQDDDDNDDLPSIWSQYIQSLNPDVNVKYLTDFTTEWLETKNSPWPEIADVKLQTFMHNRNFYSHPNHRRQTPRELIIILGKGSEVAKLRNGPLSAEFQSRICDRVEFLTDRLAKAPYFILESERDGAVHKIKSFANMWRRKETYWEDHSDHMTAQPTATMKPESNKRRKLDATKSSVAFPNLYEMPPPRQETKVVSVVGEASKTAADELDRVHLTSPLSDLSTLSTSIFQIPTHIQHRPGSSSRRPLALEDSSNDERTADTIVVAVPGNLRKLKIEPLPEIPHPAPTTAYYQPSLPSTPPTSGQTASASFMQFRHDQMTSISQEQRPTLLNANSSRCPFPRIPFGASAKFSEGDQRPAEGSMTLESSNWAETSASSEPFIEKLRPPTTTSVSGPKSPSRAFDKFLSFYGTGHRGSRIEVPTTSKKTQQIDSRASIMSPIERLRAKRQEMRDEKRAEVCAQISEWEEIRKHEKISRLQTKAPPQALTITREEMPSPPHLPLVTEPFGRKPRGTVPQDDNHFTTGSGLIGNLNLTNQPSISSTDPILQILSPIEALEAPTTLPQASSIKSGHPSEVQQSKSSSKTPEEDLANDRQYKRSSPNSNTVCVQMKNQVPMVSKTRASRPAQALNSNIASKTTAEAPISPTQNAAPRSIVQALDFPETSTELEPSTASMAPRSLHDDLTGLGSSDATSVPSTPSFCHMDLDPVLAPIAMPLQQLVPTTATVSVTPSASVNREPSKSSTPPAPTKSSSNIGIGVAAATKKTLVTQPDEVSKKGSDNELYTDKISNEQEIVPPKTPEPTHDLLRQCRRAYALVPEPTPFSATPSEEELATMQALHHQHNIRARPEPQINQERSLVKSTLHGSGIKTLEVVIESADEVVSAENGYSFDVVTNNTLSGFFSFYAATSGAPLESFHKLTFTPTWPSCAKTYVTKQMGEPGFNKVKKMLQVWYKKAQKVDPEEMDFQIMVEMG